VLIFVANTDEYKQLMQVMPMIEKVVMKVNEAANEYENKRKAEDMDLKLDRRASDVSVLAEYKVCSVYMRDFTMTTGQNSINCTQHFCTLLKIQKYVKTAYSLDHFEL